MSSSFNPYHAWLGLKPTIKNPHHFQLLGLPSSASDPAEIRRAADARLEQLSDIDPGDHAQILVAMQEKIEAACQVLSNPVSRAAYKQRLLVLATKQKRNRSSTSGNADSEPGKPSSTEPNEIFVAETVQPEPDQTATRSIDSEKENSPAIPMALPLTAALNQADGLASAAPAESKPGEHAIETIRIRKLTRKRRSLLLPIMSLLFFAIGVAGLIFLTLNFTAIVDLANSFKTGADREAKSSIEDDYFQAADLELSISNDLPQVKENAGEDHMPESSETDTASMPSLKPPVIKVSFNDEVRLRWWITAARHRLLIRQPEAAMKFLENAQVVVSQLREQHQPDDKASRKHERLFNQVPTTRKVNDLLVGFWDQVYQSCQKLGGGQQIKVGETYVGLVSVDDTSIRIKSAGVVVVYRFEDIPSGLALALGEATDREDQPLWRMQKAAFYAIHAAHDAAHKKKALELVSLSEVDHHDGTPIRDFLEFDSKRHGIPADPIDMGITDSQLQQRVNELKSALKIEQESQPVDMQSTADAIVKAERLFDEVQGENALERTAILRVLQELAVRSGQVDSALDYTRESKIWDRQTGAAAEIDVLSRLADAELDSENARRWVDSFLDLGRRKQLSKINPGNSDALWSTARSLAEKHGMHDLLNSINRLEARQQQ